LKRELKVAALLFIQRIDACVLHSNCRAQEQSVASACVCQPDAFAEKIGLHQQPDYMVEDLQRPIAEQPVPGCE